MNRPGRPQQIQERNGGGWLCGRLRSAGNAFRRTAMAGEPSWAAVRADLASHADILLGAEAEAEA